MLRLLRGSAAATCLLAASVAGAQDGGPMASAQKITAPTKDDLAVHAKRVAEVEALLRRRYKGAAITQTDADLAWLQRLVDDGVPSRAETYQLQSLGLVLGDVFAHDLGLHWVMVEDQYGRDPALQLGSSSVLLFPMTMISKRVERGEKPNLSEFVANVASQLPRIKKEAD